MDDNKSYKIQVKGTAYTFAPIDLNKVAKLQLISAMDPSQEVLLKACFGPLKDAANPEDWDALTTRLVRDEVTVDDIVKLLKKLTERTVKDLTETASESGDDAE